jgi:dTDP-4-amino-4,6-dideoxygalactose transaminase
MKLKIPSANPKAEIEELKVEINQAINSVLDSGKYILGKECETFEQEFADYNGVKYGCGVSSGTAAIHLALKALGIKTGDEVITVSHTAVATTAAIEMTGAKPIFVDISPDTFTLDPNKISELISNKTKAIIPVHIYGHPADMDPIMEIAKHNKLYVLEDCAQAHGALYKGKKVGSIGDIAAYSFYPTKNLGAIGDGGIILTSNFGYFEKLKMLREYGWKNRYISEIHGFNSRLDEIQAAILRVKLRYLDSNNFRRHEIAKKYKKLLSPFVLTPIEKQNCFHAFHLYVIQHPKRDLLQKFLFTKGVGSLVHYPEPIHLQPLYSSSERLDLPITEKIKSQILSIPMYPQLKDIEIEVVVSSIMEFFDDFKT